MSVQIIHGNDGKPAGVFIPMNEWEKIKRENKNLAVLEDPDPSKQEILAGIKEAFEEMKLVREGKLKGRPAGELLNEL